MRFLFPLFVVILLLIGCTNDKPLPGGYELLARKDKGEMVVTTLKATEFATYWKKPVAGERATLLLGTLNDISSFIAFRFSLFSYSSLDTPSVYSAKLRLYQRTSYSSADSIIANFYGIDSDVSWSEKSAVIDTFENRYNQSVNYGTVSIGPDSGKRVELKLSPALVNKWIEEGINQGCILTFESANFLTEFYASDAAVDSLWPKLEVAYVSKSGVNDTLLLDAVSDVSLLQYNSITPEFELVANPQRLLVGNATGYRSLIKFDVSSIPDGANIHNALLELKLDKFASQTHNVNMMISALPVGDSLWVPAELEIEDFAGSATGYASSNVDFVRFSEASSNSVINTYFQLWVNGSLKNYGLALVPGLEGVNPSYVSLFAGQSDSTLMPSVRITYSLPPSARFETQ